MKVLISSLLFLIASGAAHASEFTCIFGSSVSGVQEEKTIQVGTNSPFNAIVRLNGLDHNHFAEAYLDGQVEAFVVTMNIWEPSKPASRRATMRTVETKFKDLHPNLVFVTDTGEEYYMNCAGR